MTLTELIQEYHNKYITPDVLLQFLTLLPIEELNKISTLNRFAEPTLAVTEYSSGKYFVDLHIKVDFVCIVKTHLGTFTNIKLSISDKKNLTYPCYMNVSALAKEVLNQRLGTINKEIIDSLSQDINSQSLSLVTITKLLNNVPKKVLNNLRLKLNHKHNYKCYITLNWEEEHIELNFMQGKDLFPLSNVYIEIPDFQQLKEKVKPKLMNKSIYINKYLSIDLCQLINDLTGE